MSDAYFYNTAKTYLNSGPHNLQFIFYLHFSFERFSFGVIIYLLTFEKKQFVEIIVSCFESIIEGASAQRPDIIYV